ncbi:MAG: LysE family translocator [Lentimicrobium sp.]|nr:LysE family translocator [Lentimicrobium sp.]
MSEHLFHFISAGVLLGLSAGVSPGPLLTLVLTQSIKHNRTEGIKVAITPLITDLPIILTTLLILNQVAQFNLILAAISFVGGIFVAYLGVESIKIRGLNINLQDAEPGSLKKGIITNLLNPSPYLFWATVGTPLLFKSFQINLLSTILFLTSFYVFLIGSKIMIATLAARTKFFMNQKTYVIIMRILGVALLAFSVILIVEGVKYLQLYKH